MDETSSDDYAGGEIATSSGDNPRHFNVTGSLAHGGGVPHNPGDIITDTTTDGITQLGLSQVGLSQVGLSQVDLPQAGITELGLSQVGLSQLGQDCNQ